MPCSSPNRWEPNCMVDFSSGTTMGVLSMAIAASTGMACAMGTLTKPDSPRWLSPALVCSSKHLSEQYSFDHCLESFPFVSVNEAIRVHPRFVQTSCSTCLPKVLVHGRCCSGVVGGCLCLRFLPAVCELDPACCTREVCAGGVV